MLLQLNFIIAIKVLRYSDEDKHQICFFLKQCNKDRQIHMYNKSVFFSPKKNWSGEWYKSYTTKGSASQSVGQDPLVGPEATIGGPQEDMSNMRIW